MKPTCPRLFEVEAMRDGRLAGDERLHFERHLAGCAACAAEARALEHLAEAVRADRNLANDSLHLRRERTRLLAAFDLSLVAEPRPHWPAALGALALAVLVAFVPWPWHRPASAVVEVEPGTSWSEQRAGDQERIVLTQGALKLVHTAGAPRLVVSLPDGELDDTGTTFSVAVGGGRTTHVEVQEGSVVLRLRGRAPVAVAAGQRWTPEPRPVHQAEPASAALPAPAPTPAPAPAMQPTASSPGAQPKPDPSAEFRAAMAALNGGDCSLAAARFAKFEAHHPHDGRAEDAAYLKILALERCDAKTELGDAIEEYLRRYPNGFRRAEIKHLLR